MRCFANSIPTGAVLNYTPKAGEPVSRTARTQVSPAMAQFGIRYIAGYSFEARGRSERASERSRTACPRSWPWPASLQCKTSKRIVTNRNIYSINYISCIYYISFH